MSMQLQYNYAHINPETGECTSCATFSYQINHPEWILVPDYHDDYIGKFYNVNDETWYCDPEFTEIFEPNW